MLKSHSMYLQKSKKQLTKENIYNKNDLARNIPQSWHSNDDTKERKTRVTFRRAVLKGWKFSLNIWANALDGCYRGPLLHAWLLPDLNIIPVLGRVLFNSVVMVLVFRPGVLSSNLPGPYISAMHSFLCYGLCSTGVRFVTSFANYMMLYIGLLYITSYTLQSS